MTSLSPAPGVRYAGTEDGAVLLDLSSGRFFGLNPTAAAIWRSLCQGRSPEDTATRLAEDLGVPARRLLQDVRSLTEELRGRGLLRGEGPTP
ncbi:lasso peptide biosynthesis PqqD family chaperone [Nocardiopsis quinghaiensis]|uniref:lasso peptide biosynthesis PqqD family chaperone n=1 Tax=Nocardiopsis quinghaiensis TaxID=464995 RepID=UPI00123AFA97|nr:lasso peptide biosynthesis PqqD family chaperone [Nocardiopsis quinghaiensis]